MAARSGASTLIIGDPALAAPVAVVATHGAEHGHPQGPAQSGMGGRANDVLTRARKGFDAGQCSCCRGTTPAPVPDGLEEGSPFGPGVVATALYLRFTHAISDQRLPRLFEHLFGLPNRDTHKHFN